MRAKVPWRMCRSCHRKGKTFLHPDSPPHRLVGKGVCGQCGESRQLLECHDYDFRRPVALREIVP
jgi:hypothetical protein